MGVRVRVKLLFPLQGDLYLFSDRGSNHAYSVFHTMHIVERLELITKENARVHKQDRLQEERQKK